MYESEVAQSCLTLCDPMDCSLPGSSVHGIFPGKNTGVGCHFLLQHLVYSRCLISVYFLVQQSASLYSDKIAVCFDECNNQPPVYYTYKTVINAASELSNFLLLKSESVSCSVVSNSLRPLDCSTPGLPVPHHLPEFAQVHIHCITDAIQPSHPLTKILELQLQDQSFQ